jgi:hypothetical protein
MSLLPTNGPYIRYIVPHGLDKPDESKLPRVSSKEPIVGYRVWKLNKEIPALMSCYKEMAWPHRQKLVRSDDKDLNMGIHAAKHYKSLIQETNLDPLRMPMFDSVGLWSDYKAHVAGEVYLWGEVKECPHGWLAEFAYPKKLWMPENTDPVVVMQLEENYGVPVELNPDFGEYKSNMWDCLFSTSPPWTPLPKSSSKNIQFFNYPSVSVTDGSVPPDTQIEIETDDK